MTEYQVRDGSRLLTFEGQRLGHISSRRPGIARWTEMTVYKTVGGSYVLEKVGRSILTHSPGCSAILSELPRFQDAHPGDDPDEDYEYHDCVPDVYDFPSLLAEEDRYWAIISDDPAKIVDALYRRREGTRHLPRISIELLEEISANHPEFGTDWKTEHIA